MQTPSLGLSHRSAPRQLSFCPSRRRTVGMRDHRRPLGHRFGWMQRPGPEREGTKTQRIWGCARLGPKTGTAPQYWGPLGGSTALGPPKKEDKDHKLQALSPHQPAGTPGPLIA